MTVDKLIKKLQKYDKSLNVVVCINSTKNRNDTQFTNLHDVHIIENEHDVEELELLGDYNNYE